MNTELPKDWNNVKVSDIAESIQYGYTESSTKEVVGPKFLRITDIQNNSVSWDEVPFCKIDNELKKKYLLKDGDLVFARTGATVGKSFLIKGKIPEAIYASYLIRLRFKQAVIDKFVWNYFQSLHYWRQITEGQVGIGQPNVNGTKLGNLSFPLPPLPEQHCIVAKLEELLSELEKGNEQLHAALDQLKVYRQAVLKYAFEGKLTNKNVKEGELPKGWKCLKFGDVVEDFVRGPFGSSLKKEFFVPEGYKVYEQQNAIYQTIERGKYFVNGSKYQEMKRFQVKEEDYIVSCSGTIGRLYKIPKGAPKGLINQALLIIRINRSLLADKFFSYLFTAASFQRLIIKDAKGTAMLNLAGVKDLKLVSFPICSIDEQNHIVEEIERRLSVADKLEETITASLQQSETLRQSILKKAFEGNLG